MLKSYVGIASQHGIESFYPEGPHVIRFLKRRAYRTPWAQEVCFWAVVQDSIATSVEQLVACRQRQEALFLLQSLAAEVGTVCPDEPQEQVFSAS